MVQGPWTSGARPVDTISPRVLDVVNALVSTTSPSTTSCLLARPTRTYNMRCTLYCCTTQSDHRLPPEITHHASAIQPDCTSVYHSCQPSVNEFCFLSEFRICVYEYVYGMATFGCEPIPVRVCENQSTVSPSIVFQQFDEDIRIIRVTAHRLPLRYLPYARTVISIAPHLPN